MCIRDSITLSATSYLHATWQRPSCARGHRGTSRIRVTRIGTFRAHIAGDPSAEIEDTSRPGRATPRVIVRRSVPGGLHAQKAQAQRARSAPCAYTNRHSARWLGRAQRVPFRRATPHSHAWRSTNMRTSSRAVADSLPSPFCWCASWC
eukprot:5441793-Prymnesium_polylepis.2